MARNVEEIKRGISDVFIQSPIIQALYELENGKTFDDQFSKTSLESILFYDFAYGIYTLEKIFDTHRSEVTKIIENILPHRPKWYRDKSLNFMADILLIPDTDHYDTTDMTDEEIAGKKVVKYATAIEEPGSSVLVIKIATGEPGDLRPLAPEQAEQFRTYINEIRDAGVRWNLVNLPGDDFYCEIDIYYSPLLVSSDVSRAVQTAIKSYLTGLPFNGEYSNMALIDTVQAVDGVLIAEFKSAQTSGNFINAKIIPIAGYFKYVEENITLNPIPHSTAP